MKKAYFVCPLLLFAITALAQNNFVYTNDNFSPNTVSVFKVSPSNGALTLIPGSPFLTGGNGGAHDVGPQTMQPTRAAALSALSRSISRQEISLLSRALLLLLRRQILAIPSLWEPARTATFYLSWMRVQR
jgi:hypothetical protein